MKFERIKPIIGIHIQSVLPLVYDESISFYELLGKILYKLNELIKNNSEIIDSLEKIYDEWDEFKKNFDINLSEIVEKILKEWLEKGIIIDIIKNVAERTPFLDTADVKIFAQHIIDDRHNNWKAQGFSIGKWSGGAYALCSMCDGETLTGTLLTLYNLYTGEKINEVEGLELDHVNGITYNPDLENFIITPTSVAGNLQKIFFIDKNLKIVGEKTVQELGDYNIPRGIAYDSIHKHYYINYYKNKIVKYSNEWKELDSFILKSPNVDSTLYVEQNIYCDGEYLYFINSGLKRNYPNERFNKIDVYHLNGDYFKSVYVPMYLELEDIDMFDGEMYFYFNTQKSGLILKGVLKNSTNPYHYRPDNSNEWSINDGEDIVEVWCNSNSTQFLVDGTYKKPLNRMLISFDIFVRYRYQRFVLNLVGDYSNYNFNCKGFDKGLYIQGWLNDTTKGMVKVGGMYMRSMAQVYINYLEIVNESPIESGLLMIYYCGMVRIDNVIFKGNGTENYVIKSIACDVHITQSKFLSDAIDYVIRSREGGSFLIGDTKCEFLETYNAPSLISIENNLLVVFNVSPNFFYNCYKYNGTLIKTTGWNNNQTVDILKIKQEGIYQFSTGVTVLNRPTGTSATKNCTIKVVNLGATFYKLEYIDIDYKRYDRFIFRNSPTDSGWIERS